MVSALLVMAGIALVLGAMLGFASIRFKVKGDPLLDKIDAILPQTQCGQCGFPGCKPYAQAIAKGEAEINQCPPAPTSRSTACATWCSPRSRVSLATITIGESEVTKRLAAYAALVAVPTLIAGVYGMNFEHMPELHWEFGYPFSIWLMVILDAILFWRFRRAGCL